MNASQSSGCLLLHGLEVILHILAVFGHQISSDLDRGIRLQDLLHVGVERDTLLSLRMWTAREGTYLDTVVEFHDQFCACGLLMQMSEV